MKPLIGLGAYPRRIDIAIGPVLVHTASRFYVDPTHRNPVHPRTLQYLFEARGMLRVETMPLHAYPAAMHVPEGDSLLARRFNEYFYGPQDYAVVGHRP